MFPLCPVDVVEGKMGEVLGEFRCDLDGRFSSVRTAETNLGKPTQQFAAKYLEDRDWTRPGDRVLECGDSVTPRDTLIENLGKN
jgi:hypothetical protein